MSGIPQTYKGKPLVHAWVYRDCNGKELGIVGRYQNGTDKKDIVPCFKRNGAGWMAGIDLKPRPLFGLEKLAKHPKNKPVFVPEGEKPVAALQGLSITAVTSLGGSQAAKQADWTPLSGYKMVYLLPDHDAPGEHYAQDVYRALMALEEPPQVKLLRLSELPEKGDIVDWLQRRIAEWDGYAAIPENKHETLKIELKTELENAEGVPQEWNTAQNPKQKSAKTKKPLIIATIADLLAYQFPRREAVLYPVFTLGSLNMIFSSRGIGKTHMGLGVAYAAACGSSFWNWTATRAVKTLLIDGEMPGESLQTRFAAIVTAADSEPNPDNLKIITIDMNEGVMPDLSNLDGQIAIEDACQDAELIIIDNLSCLARSGNENEAESWMSIGEWGLRMRSAGKCVIFMHHSGKNGAQRGTSKREDLLDVIIELKRPTDYDSNQGARFIINYSKARHLTGKQALPFEAWLKCGLWTITDAVESTYQQVIKLANLGMTQNEIAAEMGINKSNVCRAWNQAIGNGDIKKSNREKPAKKTNGRGL